MYWININELMHDDIIEKYNGLILLFLEREHSRAAAAVGFNIILHRRRRLELLRIYYRGLILPINVTYNNHCEECKTSTFYDQTNHQIL